LSGVELHLITSRERKFGRLGAPPRSAEEFMRRSRVPCVFHPWAVDTYAADLAACDLVLIPVEPSGDYAWHKPAGRALLALALGLPVVASPLPEYEKVIARSGGGLIAHTPDDWARCVNALAVSVEQRAEMGRRGCAFVRAQYGEQRFVERYAGALRELTGAL
jgi:glycosyltransferase involved in cell wall biosynthesis